MNDRVNDYTALDVEREVETDAPRENEVLTASTGDGLRSFEGLPPREEDFEGRLDWIDRPFP